jgi:hypothetical protein
VTHERHHPADRERFYREVAQALDPHQRGEGPLEILVVGPGTAKFEFVKHVQKHAAALLPKILGVETVDHPTDGELAAFVRRYFRAADRVRPTSAPLGVDGDHT